MGSRNFFLWRTRSCRSFMPRIVAFMAAALLYGVTCCSIVSCAGERQPLAGTPPGDGGDDTSSPPRSSSVSCLSQVK